MLKKGNKASTVAIMVALLRNIVGVSVGLFVKLNAGYDNAGQKWLLKKEN